VTAEAASAPTATEAPAEPIAEATSAPTATEMPVEPAAEATATPAPAAAPTATAEPQAPAAASRVFEIIPAESEARFKINEVLRGQPKLVIGVTTGVAGQLSVDPANPGATQVGEITVDAGTLATDDNNRNRAIRNFILQTGQYPSVTFTPTEITGMPASVAVGQPFSFQIAGDLTIRDVTGPVVWDVTVTPESETRIKGLATTIIPRDDFNLAIPSVPFVASVEEQVALELDFVAQAGS
jgi:polyisoprenoid-binding protein YceI